MDRPRTLTGPPRTSATAIWSGGPGAPVNAAAFRLLVERHSPSGAGPRGGAVVRRIADDVDDIVQEA